MKLPKRISEILQKKEAFIAKGDEGLSLTAKRTQDALLAKVIEELLPQLDTKGGRILNTLKNYRLLTSLDKIYKDFNKGQKIVFASEIGDTLNGITTLNKNFFTISMGSSIPKIFEKVSALSAEKMLMRIGLSGGKIITGGFLETLIQNDGLLLELKRTMAQAITGRVATKDFIRDVNTLITGAGEDPGGVEKQLDRYAHDVYMQYDSAYSSELAKETGMKYFIYQGGKIETSRDFCVAHNNKVYTIEAAEKWATWTPSDGTYPAGYVMKSKHPNEVPSYLGYPGYSPLTDRGGYRCRHYLGWVMDDLGEKMKEDENN